MAVAGQGRYVEANAHHKRALSTFSEIGDRYFMGVCFIGLAQVALAAGRPRDAVCLLAADSAMMTALGAPRWRGPASGRTFSRLWTRLAPRLTKRHSTKPGRSGSHFRSRKRWRWRWPSLTRRGS